MKPIEAPPPAEPAKAGERETQEKKPSTSPSPRAIAPRAPETKRPPQEATRRPARTEAPAKRPAPEARPSGTPPPASPAETPRRQSETPDPSEIIDWLIKRSGG